MSWNKPELGSGRRATSYEYQNMRPPLAYQEYPEPQRIVSDDVMARNARQNSPIVGSGFGDLPDLANPHSARRKLCPISEPVFEKPPARHESKFMETFSRTSSSSSLRVGTNEEDQTRIRTPHLHPSTPQLNPSTVLSNVNLFSFSEADESSREFHYSPAQTSVDEALENADFVSIRTLPVSQSEDERNTIQSLLPTKSLVSGNLNLVGLIIGKYDYSSSALALNGPIEDVPPSLTSSSVYSRSNATSQERIKERSVSQERLRENQPNRSLQELHEDKRKEHLRNNSASSTISTASTSSTLTKSNNQQRFLRYAMGANSSQPLLNPITRWLMDNVIGWLDSHGFNPSWKETFRRNEISGNRFLELGTYDSNSMIWRQFSKSLNVHDERSSVERFIHLLRSETDQLDNPSSATSTTLMPPEVEPPRRAENRKSSATLHTISTSSVPTKPRPYSYVEPSISKTNTPRDQGQTMHPPTQSMSHAHKFFRLHHRTSSSDSTKANASTSSLHSYSHSQKSSIDESRNVSGQRKSGLFSSIWKYSGDKAAGIVKQVHPTSGNTGHRHHSRSKSSQGVLQQKKPEVSTKNATFMNRDSALSSLRSQDEATLSPVSTISTAFPPFDTALESSAESDRLISQEYKKDLIDARYLPIPKGGLEDESKLILISKDNNSFRSLRIYTKDLDNLDTLKKRIMKSLDLVNFGSITFHLTDYDCIPGEAMDDEVIRQALRQSTLCKLHVQQIVNSPGTNTISSTSSDARSFDLTGDNSGGIYPATPQYLLQDARDKGIDYINFKDQDLLNQVKYPKDSRGGALPNQHPMKLTIPVNRRRVKPKLPLHSNGQLGSLKSVKSQTHMEGFNDMKRARVPSDVRLLKHLNASTQTESSNAVDDDGNLMVKAIRSNIFKDGASRASSLGLEFERLSSLIAKRRAPPPPTGASTSRAGKNVLGSSTLPNISRGGSRRVSSKLSQSSKTEEHPNAFKEKVFEFVDVPSFSSSNILSIQNEGSYTNTDDEDDNDDFFVKPMSKAKKEDQIKKNDQECEDDDEDDFFMKPTKSTRSAELREMNVRPPVEEVYNNLEKYFPNTNLDKPIIDASPESPVVQVVNPKRAFPTTQRKESISRTFSNANNSPINPPNDEDGVIPVEGGGIPFKRMKTIRTVANEARNKRLASQRANRGAKEPPTKAAAEKSPNLLRRTNTKLWGQKVIEVTSAEIEKGFVSRIRSNASSKFEEFAWIKGELIGRGSFGSVYLALNVTTGEMLAVKQVVVENRWDKASDGLDALHKEVETMKDLDHLNIVQYLGFEQKNNTYSLFLEYVGGGSISSCLKSFGKFDEPLVKFITRQVLEGLRYLHSNGILHRDLKADNLLLETDGTCKISDFGISKKSQDIYSNNAEMSMQGTVFWMAPEVIHNIVEDKKQGYSAKVDIWSLGCVVLEMFAGQRPWSNEAVISAIYKIGKTKLAPPIPEDVSDEAKDFLKQCFTTDSEIRPTAEKLLEHPFMEVDPNFSFDDTRLKKVIKFNLKRV